MSTKVYNKLVRDRIPAIIEADGKTCIMDMLRHTKTLGIVEVDSSVWKRLNKEDKAEIQHVCEEKLEVYYRRFEK